MKKWQRFGAGVLVLALVMSLFAPQTVSAAKKKKKVKLNKKKVTLTVGRQVRLKLKNNKKKVKWSSNKKKIATVSKKGVVKAKKKGTARITAKVGKKKYTCKVTVKAKKKTTTGSKTPGTTQTVTGEPGKNIPITGDVFQIGTYKLALGLTRAQVNTILGTLSTNVKRTEKSPQGFDVIAFRPNGNKAGASGSAKYSTYILLYLKSDKVVGICGICKTMSYTNVVSAGTTAAALETNSRWSPADWYTTTGISSGAGAYQTTTTNANVLAFVDYYGSKTTYCIQAFSNEYSVESMTDLSNNEASCSYGSDVLAAMKTESGELINAYLAFYGLRTLGTNTKLSNIAQNYCSTMVKNGITAAEQAERSNAELKSAFQSAGIKCEAYGECVLVGNMDAIGFANSIVLSEQRWLQIRNESNYSVMGLGTDVYSDGSLYYPYLVIDFIDFVHR